MFMGVSMANFADMGRWLERETDVAIHWFSEQVSDASYKFVNSAIFDTPVDTSKALSNWQVGIGRGVSGEIEAYVLGKYGSTAGASRGKASALARAKLDARKPGDTIYIINHCKYIGYLEQGHSKQAPDGFVAPLLSKLSQDLGKIRGR